MNFTIPLPSRTSVRVLPALFAAVLGLVVLLPLPAHAFEGRVWGDVEVEDGEFVPEAATGAGDVEVDGVVEDDASSGAGDIFVAGEVGGNVRAAAGDIEIEGPVGGDVHAGMGDVYVNAPVDGDVDVGHGDVELGSEALVRGDLRLGSGEIRGNREAVKGDVVTGRMASNHDHPDGPSEVFDFVGWVFAALVFVAFSVLAAVVMPRSLLSSARKAEESPGKSFLLGLASLPTVFVLSVALAISVVGIPVALLLAPAYLALVFFGTLVAAYSVGRKVVMATGSYRSGNALAAMVGASILAGTTLIPVLGDLLLFSLALLGTGAAVLALLSRRRLPRATHPSYEAYVRDRAGG